MSHRPRARGLTRAWNALRDGLARRPDLLHGGQGAVRVREWMLEQEFAQAESALARGKPRRAVKRARDVAYLASRSNDAHTLRRVIALAEAIRDQGAGRVQRDAAVLVAYCSHSVTRASEPTDEPGSSLAWLLGVRTPRRVKTCPECAESVKLAAAVCRFCGYRFEDGEGSASP